MIRYPIPFVESVFSNRDSYHDILSYELSEDGYTDYFRNNSVIFKPIEIPRGQKTDQFLSKKTFYQYSNEFIIMRNVYGISTICCIFTCNHSLCPRLNSIPYAISKELTRMFPSESTGTFQIDRSLCPLCRKTILCPPKLVTEIRNRFSLLYEKNTDHPLLCTEYMLQYEKKCYEFVYFEKNLTFVDFFEAWMDEFNKRYPERSVPDQ